ncbi:hypothetical protein COB55_03975 [Candidatus Wolfebacteria bacterium]|nr:MAG: hypothetical protein COB55_03975 [Candidatus Wolfebacteria bacterium]
MILLGDLLILIIWYIVGVISHIYWWTKDHDFNQSDILFAILLGFFGPISWFIGWCVQGDLFKINRVIFKKRKSKLF